jgi:hypothetical protein
MVRIRHGEIVSLNDFKAALDNIQTINSGLRLASAPVKYLGLTSYEYMFPKLQTEAALLPDGAEAANVVAGLIALGKAMQEASDDSTPDSGIPAAYTYFGQFVDHDITLEVASKEIRDIDKGDLKPLSLDIIREQLKNRRTPVLDLDSVYGTTSDGTPVPRACAELSIEGVNPSPLLGPRPPGKDEHNDLPRKPRSNDSDIDREALIGDARNDENLIISQLHVAFLRAHRTLVKKQGLTFKEARKTLVQHYQWLIINDFLTKVVDPDIIDEILTYGNKFYRPSLCDLYMPLEFSVAAYRFGHSMVRGSYNYNINFSAATLKQLFAVTTFSGEFGVFDHVPDAWVIQWENFLGATGNKARLIDTQLVEPLYELPDSTGKPEIGVKSSLAIRNLLRGYLLRLPVGQKVAEALGIRPMNETEIMNAATAVNTKQAGVLQKWDFLLTRTPLWYYILIESAAKRFGRRLGPVGGTIVAEVLIGLVRWSEDSILSQPGWKPTLGSQPGRFTLQDLFLLAGVWG